MVQLLSKFLASIALSFLTTVAFAQEIHFSNPVVAYWDFASNEPLFMESTGATYRLKAEAVVVPGDSYAVSDEACRPTRADYMNGQSTTLAWPYFVSIDKVCVADVNTKTLRLLAQIQAPVNAYTSVFLGEDRDNVYFVINGRPFDAEGYLKLWTIQKKTGQAELKDFFVNVPGYSGGLWRDQNTFYVTSAGFDMKNTLYTLDINTVLGLTPYAGFLDFSPQFNVAQKGFEGFSMALVGGAQWLLYYNEGYESFFLNKTSGQLLKFTVETGCAPVGETPAGTWLMLCGQQDLRAMPLPF